MARTTVNIDDPVLADLKKLQQRENKPLGQLVSELLTIALTTKRPGRQRKRGFRWQCAAMGARVDLANRDALWGALDEDSRRK